LILKQLRHSCRVLRLLRRIFRSFSTFRLAAAVRKASLSKQAGELLARDEDVAPLRLSWSPQGELVAASAMLNTT
jgi:hypothetical protein